MILSNQKIITGIKPKIRPKYGDEAFKFDKTIPLNTMNFPLTKYTHWKIYGYRKDPFTGMKRPFWLNKKLPTGHKITPKLCGLDGFYDIKPTHQIE